ncbi:MAG: hypothetical protein JWQ40_1367 [Segetibacter sp.]|nr:hypothetical protein [Segetibacter sp.]
MIVYVESNFVLEIALRQEQLESCNSIIQLAEESKLQLVLPAYSLVEPYEVIRRHAIQRKKFSNELKNELQQILRSESYKEETVTILKVGDLLLKSGEDAKQQLEEMILRLIKASMTIPLTADIITNAIEFQVKNTFSPQDSLVYASVISHLKSAPNEEKCFLNRNSKDFDDPEIVKELDRYGCKIMFQFTHAFDFLKNKLSK